jgi:hypothetical protein
MATVPVAEYVTVQRTEVTPSDVPSGGRVLKARVMASGA